MNKYKIKVNIPVYIADVTNIDFNWVSTVSDYYINHICYINDNGK